MNKYSIDDFKKGDIVSVTQNENGKEVTYTGTVTDLFKPAINSGTVRLRSEKLKCGFKDIGFIWIEKVKFHNK